MGFGVGWKKYVIKQHSCLSCCFFHQQYLWTLLQHFFFKSEESFLNLGMAQRERQKVCEWLFFAKTFHQDLDSCDGWWDCRLVGSRDNCQQQKRAKRMNWIYEMVMVVVMMVVFLSPPICPSTPCFGMLMDVFVSNSRRLRVSPFFPMMYLREVMPKTSS